MPTSKKSAFTLIELSIVLVIIGLIVGGVLVGKDLISAAETRAQISQIEKYQTATNTFRVKYNALPGDIKSSDATGFGFASRGTLRGEGNGDGLLEAYYSGNAYGYMTSNGENALLWRDLSDAKLIDGSFTTATYDYATSCATPISGTRAKAFYPEAKMGNNNYVYAWSGSATIAYGRSDRKNYFSISQVVDACFTAMNVGMSPSQAYAIDKKIDDGMPQSGRVLAFYPNVFAEEANGGMNSFWAAAGNYDPGMGQQNGGACNVDNLCGPVAAGAATPISADAQTDYNAGIIDCYDNRNAANAQMQYTTQFMGGNNQSCALSFRFQ